MIKNIDVSTLKKKLETKEELILIDCREQDEWNQGHIEEAILYSLSSFPEHIKKLSNPDAQIIIQCRSGKRSMNACLMLESKGFSNISNLEGGILSWIDHSYPIK